MIAFLFMQWVMDYTMASYKKKPLQLAGPLIKRRRNYKNSLLLYIYFFN